MKRSMSKLLGITLAFAFAATAQAHEVAKGPNGGAVVDSADTILSSCPTSPNCLFTSRARMMLLSLRTAQR